MEHSVSVRGAQCIATPVTYYYKGQGGQLPYKHITLLKVGTGASHWPGTLLAPSPKTPPSLSLQDCYQMLQISGFSSYSSHSYMWIPCLIDTRIINKLMLRNAKYLSKIQVMTLMNTSLNTN